MLRYIESVKSCRLGNERPLIVWLPDDAEAASRTYPVIYMHDGQNLFDPETSFAGSWDAGQAMEALEKEGLSAILVGIANAGVERIAEYSPFPDRRHGGGRGEAYLEFLVETVKPEIDRRFPTRPGRESTGLLGSSLGGLISLYGLYRHPEVFGFCGAMSPSLWFAGGEIYRRLQRFPKPPGRLYLDSGGQERRGDWRDRYLFGYGSWRYAADIRRLDRQLKRSGFTEADLQTVIDPEGTHSETSWKARLPDALRFLLEDPGHTMKSCRKPMAAVPESRPALDSGAPPS